MSNYAGGGKELKRLRDLVVCTYGDACWLCGGQIPDGQVSVDHVVPRSKGGGNDLDNLRPAHRSCNYSRGNRAPRSSQPIPKPSRTW